MSYRSKISCHLAINNKLRLDYPPLALGPPSRSRQHGHRRSHSSAPISAPLTTRSPVLTRAFRRRPCCHTASDRYRQPPAPNPQSFFTTRKIHFQSRPTAFQSLTISDKKTSRPLELFRAKRGLGRPGRLHPQHTACKPRLPRQNALASYRSPRPSGATISITCQKRPVLLWVPCP